jgi:hypothetical protein
MKESELTLSKKERASAVRARISKVRFPEICPVCIDEAEDLVAMTATETTVDRWSERKALVGSWSRADNIGDVTPSGLGSAVVFWIPTCLLHGSDTITTPRKKIASIVVFMLLFYPLLFFSLELLTAVQYSRPFETALFATVALLGAIAVSIVYGFYPRALERYVKFLSIDRGQDKAIIYLKNDEYRKRFLEANGLNTESLQRESTNPEDS